MPTWYTVYKIFIVLFSLFSCGMIAAEPILGIILLLVSFALWGAQRNREKHFTEERRHREMLQAMQYGSQYPPKYKP